MQMNLAGTQQWQLCERTAVSLNNFKFAKINTQRSSTAGWLTQSQRRWWYSHVAIWHHVYLTNRWRCLQWRTGGYLNELIINRQNLQAAMEFVHFGGVSRSGKRKCVSYKLTRSAAGYTHWNPTRCHWRACKVLCGPPKLSGSTDYNSRTKYITTIILKVG